MAVVLLQFTASAAMRIEHGQIRMDIYGCANLYRSVSRTPVSSLMDMTLSGSSADQHLSSETLRLICFFDFEMHARTSQPGRCCSYAIVSAG
jgi:hypothetical protein